MAMHGTIDKAADESTGPSAHYLAYLARRALEEK